MKSYSRIRLLPWTVLLPLLLASTAVSQTYLGTYAADGKYHPLSKMSRWYNEAEKTGSEADVRAQNVPDWVNLHPREESVQNYQPPTHAVSAAKAPSAWANLRDNIITFAYGHERLLASPQRMTTDSTGRLIVADPAGSAVHVLGETQSFRILTGPRRRVQKPSGVAVDADDNIYVADSEQGLVAVFDSSGRFLRYFGKLGDESLFHYPTGIAIDRHSGTLYVLDTERHLLFLMDLKGNVVRRVGRYTGNDRVVDFEYPTEIAVGENCLAIMDAEASRVWITDLEGNPLHQFSFAVHDRPEMGDRVGLAIDSVGNVYVTRSSDGSVRVYGRDGRLASSFGHSGDGAGEWRAASGLWIDAHDRLYVGDQDSQRIQLFQLIRPTPVIVAAGE